MRDLREKGRKPWVYKSWHCCESKFDSDTQLLLKPVLDKS